MCISLDKNFVIDLHRKILKIFCNMAVSFTSSEEIEEIQFWDRTVEIIGSVENIIPRKATGATELLKFYLSNQNGKYIQCVVWGPTDINALEDHIVLHEILHIDGAWARVPSRVEFNKGNVPFELQLFSSTIINSLGQHLVAIENQDFEIVDLPNVIHFDSTKTIRVIAFLKTNFVEQRIGVGQQFGTYGCGSITNGSHKLEVRIASFRGVSNFEKGQHVSVTGRICNQGPRIFLQTDDESDIELVDDAIMTLPELLSGFREMRRIFQAGEEPSNLRRRE
ncbi:uncharacterized protein LOC122501877 isoform X1 [Leptopilina heterotoma]|uniref:uncharacterized protein LOC122501877 isoform X1 n=1 Tax=Leptopilina heterotoma TaxID=63436 RepID=UPI001CA88F67|nr:uncharacterized protein LOC122501877 isoform X1 [Leptopilina heterotoma]